MKPEEVTTTDLADFCAFDRRILLDILQAWEKHGLPENFHNDGVHPMLNRNSGHVFLVNSEYQVAMMADGKLEIWYNCQHCGAEDFKENLFTKDPEMCLCDECYYNDDETIQS